MMQFFPYPRSSSERIDSIKTNNSNVKTKAADRMMLIIFPMSDCISRCVFKFEVCTESTLSEHLIFETRKKTYSSLIHSWIHSFVHKIKSFIASIFGPINKSLLTSNASLQFFLLKSKRWRWWWQNHIDREILAGKGNERQWKSGIERELKKNEREMWMTANITNE